MKAIDFLSEYKNAYDARMRGVHRKPSLSYMMALVNAIKKLAMPDTVLNEDQQDILEAVLDHLIKKLDEKNGNNANVSKISLIVATFINSCYRPPS